MDVIPKKIPLNVILCIHLSHYLLVLSKLGTLTPICKHPDLAIIPSETKKILERLANRRDVFVAIISGRSVANVKDMVGIEGMSEYNVH